MRQVATAPDGYALEIEDTVSFDGTHLRLQSFDLWEDGVSALADAKTAKECRDTAWKRYLYRKGIEGPPNSDEERKAFFDSVIWPIRWETK